MIKEMSGSEAPIVWLIMAAMTLATAVATGRLRWLTPGGGASALAVGLVVLAGTGIAGLTLLLLFFLTSSALTTVNRRRHRPREGRRAVQVLANGGVAALAAVSSLTGLFPGSVYVVVGSLAAATADTWATELGTQVGARTRLVTTWEPVPPGRSGGVSWPGSFAAVAGAALIGLAAALLLDDPSGRWGWLAVGATGGVCGTIADSFIGAGIEGRVRWIDNNVVNWICTATGGAAGWIVGRVLLG